MEEGRGRVENRDGMDEKRGEVGDRNGWKEGGG